MMPDNDKVNLLDLSIFRRYSLALREEFGDRDEVLAALEESRRQLRGSRGRVSRGLDSDPDSTVGVEIVEVDQEPGPRNAEAADTDEDSWETASKPSTRGKKPAKAPRARSRSPRAKVVRVGKKGQPLGIVSDPHPEEK